MATETPVVVKKEKKDDDEKPVVKKEKRKRDDAESYAVCKPPNQWPAELLRNVLQTAGLKKGKNRNEMAEILCGYIVHLSNKSDSN